MHEIQKRDQTIKLRCTREEKKEIVENAFIAGMTTSDFLRNVGQKCIPYSRLDNKRILALLKFNADLGRLAGLFKLALMSGGAKNQLGRDDLNCTYREIQTIKKEISLIVQELANKVLSKR